MTATCSLRLPGGTPGEFDPETGTTPTTPHPAYHSGRCRIQAMSTREHEALVAEQEVRTLAYLVTVEWDAATTAEQDIEVDHLVHIDTVGPHGDPTLAGKDMLIRSVVRGSLVFERDLVCTDTLD